MNSTKTTPRPATVTIPPAFEASTWDAAAPLTLTVDPDGEDPLEVAVGASIEVALLPPPPPVFVPLPMPEPPIMPPMPEPPPMPVGMADPDPDPDPVPVAMPVLVFGALVLVSPDEVSCRRALGVSLQVFFRFCHPRQPREHSGIPLTWAATTAARVARKIETNFIFGLVDVD